MNIQQMMKQAQALQTKMAELQAKLGEEIVSGQSGGGMVKIECNCKGEVKKVSIDPSATSDVAMLEDLIVAAFKNAKDNADSKMAQGMSEISSSLGLPTNLNFPF